MAEFHPFCPGCRYDLDGLRVNVCPECGREFDLARMRWEWEHPEVFLGQDVSPHWLLALAMFLCWPCAGTLVASRGSDEREVGFVFAVVGAGLMTWWACLLRERLAWSNPWLLLWLMAPFALPLEMHHGNVGFLGPFWPVSALITVAVLIGWWSAPRRSMVAPILLCAIMMFVPGIQWTLAGIDGLLHGVTWTRFDDPRPGQVHAQYPLNSREALWIGAPTLGVSVAMFVAAVWKERVRWRTARREAGESLVE